MAAYYVKCLIVCVRCTVQSETAVCVQCTVQSETAVCVQCTVQSETAVCVRCTVQREFLQHVPESLQKVRGSDLILYLLKCNTPFFPLNLVLKYVRS